jgi:hypothetical protein
MTATQTPTHTVLAETLTTSAEMRRAIMEGSPFCLEFGNLSDEDDSPGILLFFPTLAAARQGFKVRRSEWDQCEVREYRDAKDLNNYERIWSGWL